ncbi:DUF192 domain-containing protein [Rubrobacter tropicus]|uniref:DUF192 domain-containing protein n=1 Tax=Rubrobacter tropicus TaxID=2653851 RepID=A0A6G8Q6R0_9ACTN|nr:DUF192 domain-containing protein [Rubrobacter tropicus]QIN82174.1 DUF192 domain-containing protein [Rubrobacter tropicus]
MRASKIALVALSLLLAGCGGDSGAQSPGAGSDGEASEPAGQTSGVTSGQETVTIEASGGESVEVRVEIADDEGEMARGLMGRTALAEDAGMLFVYPEERELSFWMKDTLIPLSIAFMDAEGRIVDIQEMKALDDRPPHYTSAEPARYALEANEGFFDERGVNVGDRARLPV